MTRLELDQNELELIEHSVKEMEDECGMDRNAALADMRYTFIEERLRRHGGEVPGVPGAAAQRGHRRGAHQQVPGPAHLLRHHAGASSA